MSRSTVRSATLVLIVLALTMFVGEAVHELRYANAHPGVYGSANVIALACGAGAVLALAGGIALLLLTPGGGGVRPLVLVLLIATAVAIGVWLVTLTAVSSGTPAGGSGGVPANSSNPYADPYGFGH